MTPNITAPIVLKNWEEPKLRVVSLRKREKSRMTWKMMWKNELLKQNRPCCKA
jgi:hypothetical protein